jgi:hypothetical protein
MGMAIVSPPPRAPYRMENGLMHCEACYATYSRGGWCRAQRLNGRNDTTPDRYSKLADIPDDVCPFCRTPEEAPSEGR